MFQQLQCIWSGKGKKVISSTIWGWQPSNAVVLYCNGRTKKCSIGTKLQHWVQWQLSTPSTPLPIRYQSSTTGDTSSRVAEKNQGEYIHFQCSLIIDQCNANWSKSVSSNTQQLNCHLDPNPIPMHCKTNTCRYQSNTNQEPLFYHLDMSNQCRWLGYQWTITQPIQSQPRTTILPLGQEKPMQMTWLPMNNHSTNSKPTKNHYYTTGTRETNSDDLITNEQPLNQSKAN